MLFSEILRQRPSPDNSCTYCTLGLSFEGCFLVFHLFGEFLKNRLIERIALSKPLRILVMYVMYIRRVYGRAFSRSSSKSDGFVKLQKCWNLPQSHAVRYHPNGVRISPRVARYHLRNAQISLLHSNNCDKVAIICVFRGLCADWVRISWSCS